MTQRVFIIDDEEVMLRLASDVLKDHHYEVGTSLDPVEGLKRVEENPPDLLLLDIRMPKLDGLELCKKLRANPNTKGLPIIIVSTQDSEADVVAGLEVGADDYVVKPVRERELMARVKAVLRRQDKSPAPKKLTAGPLTLDLLTYKATLEDMPLSLSPKEFKCLTLLLEREGQVITRSTLSENVWGVRYIPTSHTISSHIDSIRQKLGKFRHWLQTLKGVGYRFEPDE